MSDGMRGFADAYLLFTIFAVAASRSHFEFYKKEGHSIMKRMAESEEVFDEHDVATVHLVEGQGQRRKRMARSDLRMLDINGIMNSLELGLSSGSKLNLALRPADIGHADTVVSYHTENGYDKEKRIATDCYFYGQMEDSTGIGWAAISHCDGVFGFASSPSYEYFLQPVGHRRSEREAGDEFDVHVLWRRTTPKDVNVSRRHDEQEFEDEEAIPNTNERVVIRAACDEGYENATSFVIELAMFSDEQFYRKLEQAYPGREDDFLLTRLAGTQALYSDREKVGYDVKIKLKLLEYWKTDPINYTFTEEFPKNLRSFCHYSVKNYVYDIHALNTGISRWNDGIVGLAHVGGVCSSDRCLILKGLQFFRFIGFAHELGHTLGLTHRNTLQCPLEDRSQGFMGGGPSLLFAPCMRYKLYHFFKSGRGKCLFKETRESKTPANYQSVPPLFPGESRTPDGLCHILAGTGYRYLTNERPFGSGVCLWFVCLNEDRDSPEFLRAKRFFAPMGFPCQAESFCQKDHTCRTWNATRMTVEPETLMNMTKIPQWTEWLSEISPCSRSCGTGIRLRHRECQYADYNLALYCPGLSVDPELCNTHPCEGEPTTFAELRQIRRDEVCERFYQNNVSLSLKRAKAYLPRASGLTPEDTGPNNPVGQSRSCLLKCVRDPESATADLDAIVPDGTLCEEYRRTQYDVNRLNIQMRCLRGQCHEFSDCPDGKQVKDACGICDGDGSRCFRLNINPIGLIRKNRRAELTIIPLCATNIDVFSDISKSHGMVLELWSQDDKHIIGEGCQDPKVNYEGSKAIEFAGTQWTYLPDETYLRAPGPLNESVRIKAFRKKQAVKKIYIQYARCV